MTNVESGLSRIAIPKFRRCSFGMGNFTSVLGRYSPVTKSEQPLGKSVLNSKVAPTLHPGHPVPVSRLFSAIQSTTTSSCPESGGGRQVTLWGTEVLGSIFRNRLRGNNGCTDEMFADSPTLTARHRHLTSVTFSDVGLSSKVSNPIGQTLCRSWAVNR